MEFRILGPLEVVEDGRTVDVGAAKQRALLAVLLLNANRVVSRDELIEALWGERAPRGAPPDPARGADRARPRLRPARGPRRRARGARPPAPPAGAPARPAH